MSILAMQLPKKEDDTELTSVDHTPIYVSKKIYPEMIPITVQTHTNIFCRLSNLNKSIIPPNSNSAPMRLP